MKICCPHCGPRDVAEFTYRGTAQERRPESDADMFEYVYLRDNPAGLINEFWYHVWGCNTWLVVTRDTLTNVISKTMEACSWVQDCQPFEAAENRNKAQ